MFLPKGDNSEETSDKLQNGDNSLKYFGYLLRVKVVSILSFSFQEKKNKNERRCETIVTFYGERFLEKVHYFYCF